MLNIILLLAAQEGSVVGGLAKLFIIVACVLFAICAVAYRPAPNPYPWHGRIFSAAFFFWTASIVIQILFG